MTSPGAPSEFEVELPEKLLSLSTLVEQLAALQAANLLHTSALFQLLDVAAAWVRSNPRQARQLAILCTEAAEQAAIWEVIPRAAYIRAQTHALAGELGLALELIQSAQTGYKLLGQQLSAHRTTVGLMHVLGESGRYQEALAAGQAVLAEIGQDTSPELMPLAALIQQNMGMCYNQIGRYEEALAAYHAAEGSYLALGMTHQASDISNNRGVLLWEMGQGTEALAALQKSLAIRAEAGETMLQAQSLSNIGSVHLLLGNYSASLEAFEQARRLFAALDVLTDQNVLLLDTANAYLMLNLYPEALSAYREADSWLAEAGAIHHRARALWGMGSTLLAQGQLDEAETVLDTAVSLLEGTANTPTPLLATILLEQAAVQSARNRPAAAVTTANHALSLVSGHDWPVPAIYAHLQLADLARDELAQAEVHLTAAQQLAEPFGLPQLRYRLYQRFGRLRQQQGRHQEAQSYLEAALTEIEQLRGNLAQETIRTAFLHDKVAVYNELIQLHLDKGNARSAFSVAEQAKSRALLDLISGGIELKPDTTTIEADQLRQLQADLNAIYNELLKDDVDRAEGWQATVRARAAELEAAIKQLHLRQAAMGGTADLWAIPKPLPTLQAQLPETATLLAYHIIGEEILAFVVRRDAIKVFRKLGQAAEVQGLVRRLSGMLDRMRAGAAFNKHHIASLELSLRRLLTTLYQRVMAPLADYLAETALLSPQLTIIPHGFLHQLPFHALFDGQDYLIEHWEIAYAPSANIYLHCQQRPSTPPNKALILGVSDPSIPAVAAEVNAVAGHLPQAQFLIDEEATITSFQTHAADCDLLHLACHGLYRADNPLFSALKLYDGWLTATEAMQLRLRDALVTLSACESGRSQVAGGDELLGLLRAFLSAGAATVVVSLWLVQDDTTARLMANWYEQLQEQGLSPAAALRAAQLNLKADYPHPYYWAPFITVGRR